MKGLFWNCLAEREGFEPPDPCGSTVFKTAAIDRSAISPGAKLHKFQRLPNNKPPLAVIQLKSISPPGFEDLPISFAKSTHQPYLCRVKP